ncbi:transcriptional regulator [Serratia nematodiphila DZ0503SBS1]|nr:transcriptional regulator [Serratia nematodiphila DZ0503SBS1]
MQKREIRRGRPTGSTSFEAERPGVWMAVKALRTERGTAQEALGNMAGIERAHMGRIERGEHMPTLALILRIAEALECSAALLIEETEKCLKLVRAGVMANEEQADRV